ncbi:sigma-70 family RNA polymerase sigma factor [Lachnospiraceae bacterium 46-61]
MENGKQLFLEKLYTLYVEELYNFACKEFHYDKNKADEAIQEMFLIACIKVDTLYQSQYPKEWLKGVLKNVIKREKFRLYIGKTKDGEYKFCREIDIDTIAEENLPIEEMKLYENYLFEELEDILSKREIKFVKERYLNDKTYKDIAKTLQIKESACTSFGNRIHKKVKKFLKNRDKANRKLDI